ncbi:MAG TPA: cyclic nucleotide-binding domain-containing protein [Bryobacterales bacterium]|nr:cyclic nucleotide-binding domain-containing protein [Bryobacterales bacterium]
MTQEQVLQTLKVHGFTQGMTEAHRSKLATLAEEVCFREDETIFRAGDILPYLYCLVSGSACLEIRTPVYAVCVQALAPGDAFGWSSLVSQHYSLFQVRARESCLALRLDAAGLLAACRDDPSLGLEVFRQLSELIASRLRATELKLAEFCGVLSLTPAPRLVSCSQASSRP